jgi:hypothetical protein
MVISLFKDYGSDPVVGFIAIIGTIFVYIIWFAIAPDSASKHIESGMLKQGETGTRTARNRRKRHNTRRNEINRMKLVTSPNIDGKYLYIFQSNGLFKVGISTNPEYRRKQIQKKLSNQPVGIGRTIDAETFCHRDLAQYNIPVHYNNGTTSPEWFKCSIEKVLSITEKYADMY